LQNFQVVAVQASCCRKDLYAVDLIEKYLTAKSSSRRSIFSDEQTGESVGRNNSTVFVAGCCALSRNTLSVGSTSNTQCSTTWIKRSEVYDAQALFVPAEYDPGEDKADASTSVNEHEKYSWTANIIPKHSRITVDLL
jgi:hypothetical protein